MKQTILLFFGLLFTTISQAQVWHEGIVKGKKVKYDVTNPEYIGLDSTDIEKRKTPWFVVRNTKSDTTSVRCYSRNFLSWYLDYEIIEILCKHLSREEISQLKSPKGYVTREEWEQLKSLQNDEIFFQDDGIYLDLRVDGSISKILQVSCFTWQRHSFWMNFSPDRLYRIEQDIIANVKLPEIGSLQKLFGSKYELRIRIYAGGLARLAGYTPEERLYWKNETLKYFKEWVTELETDKEALERMKRFHGITDR